MVELTEKSVAIETALENLSQAMFGVSRQVGVCPFCKAEVSGREDFRDSLSWTEYRISHLCQKCQDEFWPEEVPNGVR